MALKIYGLADSPCTQRAIFALLEKEVTDWELVKVDLRTGAHKKPEHVERQPFGQVPVLDDEGTLIFESRAVIRYIAKKFASQGTPLTGANDKEAGVIDSWLEAEHSNYFGHIQKLTMEKVFGPLFGRPTNEAAVEESLQGLSKVLDVYEKELAKHQYLGSDSFSLADLSHVTYTWKVMNVGKAPLTDLFANHPNVAAWWDRISTRSAWKATLDIVAASHK